MIADEALVRLTEAMASLRDAGEMKAFLTEMLTPTEIHDFALRWEIVERLVDGVPQRKIATDLHASLCKITRGSKILKDPDGIVAGLLADRGVVAGNRRVDDGTRISGKS